MLVSIAPASGVANLDKQRTQLRQLLSCGLILMKVLLLERMASYHSEHGSDFLLYMTWSSIGSFQDELDTATMKRPPVLIRRPVFGPGGSESLGLEYDKSKQSLAVLQIPRIGMLLVLAPKRDGAAVQPMGPVEPMRLNDDAALHMHETSQDRCCQCKSESAKLRRCKNCLMSKYCG